MAAGVVNSRQFQVKGRKKVISWEGEKICGLHVCEARFTQYPPSVAKHGSTIPQNDLKLDIRQFQILLVSYGVSRHDVFLNMLWNKLI